MIGSINSSAGMPPPPRNDKPLTAEQSTLITDTLAEYDLDNLSDEDASAIVSIFNEAGIQPGKALQAALAAEGIDAKALGDQVKKTKDAAANSAQLTQDTQQLSEITAYLTELLESKYAEKGAENLTDDDKTSIYAQVLEKFGLTQRESIIKTTA
ncbi:hypothetical protein [Rheinheimera sp. UJ63]|uniref:hypothetical protein n=1 Tax=Rheinheimera sp. UJ63 TaxID=2910157 RepID=UPI001F23D795|nr:hypothetical protein [Rheinheimera sp. UJ63]MCF4010777.1 hypothetical protein [Rheinheimera sp. UJ63]